MSTHLTTVAVKRRQCHADGAVVRDANGDAIYETIKRQVRVEIDLETILNDVAVSAAHNRTGRSKALGGLIRAKVVA